MSTRDSTSSISGTTVLTITSGATTLNCALSNDFTITPAANVLVSASNLKAGQTYRIILLTSGTASYNIVFSSTFKSQGVYRTSRTSGIYDIITFYCDGTNLIEVPTRKANVYTPAEESSCILMLEADSYSGNDASNITTSWTDYSALARNCAVTGTPTFETNELNGLSIARIGGSGIYWSLPNLSSLTSGAMYIVMKLNTYNDGGDLFGTSGIASHYSFNNNNIYDDFGSTSRQTVGVTGTAINAWHLKQVYSRPSFWQMLQNNTSVYSTTTNTVGFNSTPKLGQNYTPTSQLADYYGIYMFNDQLDLSADKRVRDYIKFRTTIG